MRKALHNVNVMLGADPELFLVEKGEKSGKLWVRGSERVIPAKGVSAYEAGQGLAVRDGVQIELHPHPHTCRESLAYYLNSTLKGLQAEVAKYPGFHLDFNQVVKVSKLELSKLAPENQVLGCNPSFNCYGIQPPIPDGTKMLLRSGSGHIHLGSEHIGQGKRIGPDKLVPVLDLMVGIPSVMLDRDPLAAERRKYYGRAGEYRLPKHGLEYRTPSNFWLRSYTLMSLMMAQARQAVGYVMTSTKEAGELDVWGKNKLYTEAVEELLADFDPEKVQAAINNNDLALATEIFEKSVKPVIKKTIMQTGLSQETLPAFEFLVKDGIDKHFPIDTERILMSWTRNTVPNNYGWENYSGNILDPARKAAEMAAAAERMAKAA